MKAYTPAQLRAAIVLAIALTSLLWLMLFDRSCQTRVASAPPPPHSVAP